MDDKIVLICATGRSGSTTLQRIINTIPNANICGENYGAINSLLEFYKNLHIASQQFIPGHYNPASYEDIINKNVKPSWYNSYKINEIEEQVRQTIITMFKKDTNTNIWGFKEIRYDNKKIHLIKYFKMLFPQTKVILQIRKDINSQCQSSWYKNDKNAFKYLQQTNKELWDFYKVNKDWCYFTTFEEMFDKYTMENIFKFIDCHPHYDDEKINDVLKNNLKD